MSDRAELEKKLDTSVITQWRSIVTLIVFVVTNIIVLFPFDIPFYVPSFVVNGILDLLSACRITSPRPRHLRDGLAHDGDGKPKRFVLLRFPMNFVTAPLIADLFLLAILAIGGQEVHDGIVGVNSIVPYDIMLFFLTLAYIAISIDASGLIRYLAFKVLQIGGSVGHRLFFYLYAFFFALGSFIGNDPIILSGTAFLAYMTRVSSNIVHPRAWIHTQFAIANIASAILVSSNPTNLVLAGAFEIKFLVYTANMIVPVVVTAIVLFPFLLYIIFADEALIPVKIDMHQLPEEARNKKPVNPNIPNARGAAEAEENKGNEEGQLLSLEEIMNPFVDRWGAGFGGVIMAATLVAVLVLNATSMGSSERPVFYVTLPAAVIMMGWDLASGWRHRHETREIARKGREEVRLALARQALQDASEPQEVGVGQVEQNAAGTDDLDAHSLTQFESPEITRLKSEGADKSDESSLGATPVANDPAGSRIRSRTLSQVPAVLLTESSDLVTSSGAEKPPVSTLLVGADNGRSASSEREVDIEKTMSRETGEEREKTTLASASRDLYRWCQETFPTTTAVLSHLPFALVPFAFCMFILVQALVTKGWVPVFAYGWDHWVNKTGTIGAIGGMGFLSVIMCNFAGTNIGTTILLSRVIQSWGDIHIVNGIIIGDRTYWATIYAMALGVNYGAFSIAFSASLAGLLWRDILLRKHIRVRRLDFARVNIPIIAVAMIIGCAVLVGEVYIMRRDDIPAPLKPS